ncbi:MAG: type I 3-dehydroquinate dehydratase [Proteobacteria bacterium]|nr:type I 3-dehydroquinate dehydratase [Pseudomonadota bacterium]MBU1139661.1 type I 3-dehydroquinate dehydratase [Pseudomonadota bacterium]MBU1233393.1 type I 3-dehydroquinate dehydratase [Pseudomonadota bacterium]MBU1417268.1 type I 3-dehydroquinate dehydratase [Pseudomonadota bacterium]MBU1453989.1 type I 3-dehydroquinate dehydratase [Pseudomonadota bacterium]
MTQHSFHHHRICVSIGRETIDDALAAADSAASLADVLEIRLDSLSVPAISPFISTLNKPLLFTNRPKWEGGHFDGREELRIATLVEAVKENCAYVDLEVLAPASSHQELFMALQGVDTRLILSWHNFQETPTREELVGRMAMMQDKGADIGKIVTLAHSHQDVLRVLQLQEVAEQLGFPLIAFCMGRAGVISRIATVELGGYMTYCAVSEDETTAPGQLSLATLAEIYSLMGT